MTTPCKFISRDSQGVHCCSSEPCGVSASDMWVSQLCIKKVLSHFSPRKKSHSSQYGKLSVADSCHTVCILGSLFYMWHSHLELQDTQRDAWSIERDKVFANICFSLTCYNDKATYRNFFFPDLFNLLPPPTVTHEKENFQRKAKGQNSQAHLQTENKAKEQ